MAKRFRNSLMHQAGHDAAIVAQCRVINVNMVNWTVDVVSQFDRHHYSDIQVSSLYLHYDNGEGVYVMPEVGAQVMVTIPSDTSPPYVSAFLAPMSQAADATVSNPTTAVQTSSTGTQSADPNAASNAAAPSGTRSRGGAVPNPGNDASFAAGRYPANPGDIIMRGRDGNFAILHRGGVLSIGATEIAQRIYIPLGNKVMDVSGEFEHQNIGGSIHWGIQQGPSVKNPATECMETYRVFANDQFASIRVASGKVLHPVGEPDGETDNATDILYYEVAVASGGFKAVSGDLSDPGIRNQTVLRFFFDKVGNVFLRCAGTALFNFKKSLTLKIATDFNVSCKTMELQASDTAKVGGGSYTEITGATVKVSNGANQAVARMGDAVQVTPLAPDTLVMIANPQIQPPAPLMSGAPITFQVVSGSPWSGLITGGNPAFLA